ncbi:MAG TPA: epoxide hydrolase, partial [Candidatus Hodarchaeales archaeon]|nr:epoxide hydrolase [Candidatus Hodarchaeales archaeon]
MTVTPFKISVDQVILDDLKSRLARTRWPDEISNSNWDYGTNLAYMKELVDYWIGSFDWRAQEEFINSFNNYLTEIDGLKIHFIHERGSGDNPLPLIITHGWPSSFFQMLKIIPLLAHPERFGGKQEDSFDVIVPSMPGYGFSDARLLRGRVPVAKLWGKLMVDVLGYKRFAAQGGDVGTGVTERLAIAYANHVVGIHLTDVHADVGLDTPSLSKAERNYLIRAKEWDASEGAYDSMQATKPQTLAYGLNDSPAGLAAYIIEKFFSWGDCRGHIERSFTKDELLTNITIY